MVEHSIKNILVVGGGESGGQIALQFARFGFRVAIHDVTQDRLDACHARLKQHLESWLHEELIQPRDTGSILERIAMVDDPQRAAANADLLCECVPEDLNLKREILRQFHPLCKPEAIFTTNTSYLLPSSMARASGRPERFAAYHFHTPVWVANAVDIMPTSHTDPEVVDTLYALSKQAGLVPIKLLRENPGYVFNAVLHPLLLSSLDLVAREVADTYDVDRAWMAITKMPIGPLGMVDKIGLDTVHTILEQWEKWLGDRRARRAAEMLKGYLDDGRLGEKNAKGFYDYPSPEYASPNFLLGPITDTTLNGSPTKQRLLPVAVPAPLESQEDSAILKGRYLLWGVGPLADHLAKRLESSGEVCRYPAELQEDQLAEWLTMQWQRGPLTNLILVAAAATSVSTAEANDRKIPSRRPFVIAQHWYAKLAESHLLSQASLLGFTLQTDPSGSAKQLDCHAGLGLSGLVKSISMESFSRDAPGIRSRIINFDSTYRIEEQAEGALNELARCLASEPTADIDAYRQRHADLEVNYSRGERYLARYSISSLQRAQNSTRIPHGTWLVSGGASGITMKVATAMARRYGLRLHLLGRTPLPQVDHTDWTEEQFESHKAEVMRAAYQNKERPDLAWAKVEKGLQLQRALKEYKSQGISATYHACNVVSEQCLQKIIQEVQDNGEQINGILHGAGVEETKRFEAKSLETFQVTVAPKTLGTQTLFRVAKSQPLEWFISFGSLAGRFGSIGQADYALANDALAHIMKQCQAKRPDCNFLTVHWPGWEEVGMAARSASQFMLQQANQKLMPVEEGIDWLLQEIEAGAPNEEVVIADPQEIGAEFLV